MHKSIGVGIKRILCWAMVPFALCSIGIIMLAAPHKEVTAGSNMVDDGSFEAGRNAGIWKEVSTNFGTPICSFGKCGDGAGTAHARTGSFWAWFGGASTFEERGSLTQNVTFPSGGTAKLRFYLWIGDSSPDGRDYVKVLVDGQKVFSAKESSTKYDSYTLVTKDLSQFADGLKHKVQFKNRCTGDGNSNFNVDDVSITAD